MVRHEPVSLRGSRTAKAVSANPMFDGMCDLAPIVMPEEVDRLLTFGRPRLLALEGWVGLPGRTL